MIACQLTLLVKGPIMTEQANIHPQKVFDYVISRFPSESVKSLYNCIVDAIIKLSPRLDELEVYATADRVENSVRALIDAHIEEYRERKLPPIVYWNELDENKLIGRCFVFMNDSTAARLFKQKLLLIEQVQKTIGSLSWTDFEKFCRKYTALQPRFTNVRKKRHDGGIDFHGTFIISSTHRVRFGGQAKKYGIRQRIGPNFIRELDGSLDNYGYAFGIIMATCSFTKGARKYARRKSIDAIDCEQIAFGLIRLGIGLPETGNQTNFSEGAFRIWLR